MKRDFPWLRISLGARDPSYLKDIDRLGVWSIVNRVGSLLSLQASLIVTNLLLGAYDEGCFSLVVSLVSMISTACMAIANVFNPFLFRYYSLDDMDSMADTGRMGMRFLSLLLALPLAFVCVFSPEVLTAWVGPEYVFLEDVIWVMFIFLTLQSLMSILDVVPTITLRVKGMALITIGFGLLNLLLATSFCLFTDWGLMGIAMAWAISMTLRGCVAYPIYISWTIGAHWRSFFQPQAVGAILFVTSTFALYSISTVIEMPSSLVHIIPIFLVIYASYVLISMRFVFRGKDREMLLSFMPDRVARLIARII
jgi:membrane protein EpsK